MHHPTRSSSPNRGRHRGAGTAPTTGCSGDGVDEQLASGHRPSVGVTWRGEETARSRQGSGRICSRWSRFWTIRPTWMWRTPPRCGGHAPQGRSRCRRLVRRPDHRAARLAAGRDRRPPADRADPHRRPGDRRRGMDLPARRQARRTPRDDRADPLQRPQLHAPWPSGTPIGWTPKASSTANCRSPRPAPSPARAALTDALLSDSLNAHVVTPLLREHERFLHRLTEALPMGVAQISSLRRVVHVNALLASMLGHRPITTIDQLFEGVLADDQRRTRRGDRRRARPRNRSRPRPPPE